MESVSQKLELCKLCTKRKFNTSVGIICSLTNEKPAFENQCEHYEVDEKAQKSVVEFEKTDDIASGIQRFVNRLVDVIVFYILTFILGILLAVGAFVIGSDLSWLDNISRGQEFIAGLIIYFAYYMILEGVFSTTIGKLITKTKVVTVDGEKPTMNNIAQRTLCRLIPFNAFSFLFNDAVGWHDSLSNTRVVNK